MPRLLSCFAAPLTRRIGVRLLTLSVVWAAVFAPLYYFASVRPRRTIPLNSAANGRTQTSVVGITPNGQELVALTTRLRNRTVDGRDEGVNYSSGPLQIWNLQTGTRRTVCLPLQNCHDPVDSELWQARLCTAPRFRGRWLQLGFEPWQKAEYHRDPPANLLVNLDTEDYHLAPDTAETVTGLELSRTGRWFVELQSSRTLWKHKSPRRLRVIETATSKELLALDVPHYSSEWAFSPDDRLFALANRADASGEITGRLSVWQTASLKLLYEVERSSSAPVFSPDSQRLAAMIEEPEQTRIVVLEAKTWTQQLEDVVLESAPVYDEWHHLQFGPDSHWLYYSRPREPRRSSLGAYNHRFDPWFVIDLRKNKRRGLAVSRDSRWCESSQIPDSVPPLAVGPDQELRQLPTGRQIGQLEHFQSSLNVSRNGRLLLLQQEYDWEDPSETEIPILEFFERLHIPTPTRWGSSRTSESEWFFKEIPSNRTIVRMPAQKEVHWLSPDERTLVTQPRDGSHVAHVWDFPPRKPFWSTAAWALIGPSVIGLWWWMRRKLSPASTVTT